MEIHLTTEMEAKLNELSKRTQRGTDELLEEAIGYLVEYNDWFEQKVNASIAAVKQGQVVSNETARGWLEERERYSLSLTNGCGTV